MPPEFKRITWTCPPKADESLRGYLLRLSIENGYRSLSKFMEISGSPKSRPSTFDSFDLAPLSDLTAQPKADLERLVYRPTGDSSRLFLGHTIPSFLISPDRLKFCPSCIEEEPSFKAIWDLQLSVVCLEHRTYLISECEECKRPATWFGSPWYQCACKHDLRCSPAQSEVGRQEWTPYRGGQATSVCLSNCLS